MGEISVILFLVPKLLLLSLGLLLARAVFQAGLISLGLCVVFDLLFYAVGENVQIFSTLCAWLGEVATKAADTVGPVNLSFFVVGVMVKLFYDMILRLKKHPLIQSYPRSQRA